MDFGSTNNTTRDKIPYIHLFKAFPSVLLAASLKSLQAEGPQINWALSSSFSRDYC